MDYWRAIRFPVDNAGWIAKIIIGSVIGLIPIVNFAQQGYGLEVVRRVATGQGEELPAWDQFGTYILKGLGVAVAVFIYILPVVFLGLLLAVSGASEALVIPVVLVLVLYGLLVAAFLPAAMAHYAVAGYWSAMFDFGWISGFIGNRLGSYVAVLLVTLVFTIVAGVIGGIVILVGSLVANFWTVLVLGHLLGQLMDRGAAPAR